MKSNTLAPANKGVTLTPEDRERLTLAYRAARLRCGLSNETESRGPVSLAGRLTALLRRIGGAK